MRLTAVWALVFTFLLLPNISGAADTVPASTLVPQCQSLERETENARKYRDALDDLANGRVHADQKVYAENQDGRSKVVGVYLRSRTQAIMKLSELLKSKIETCKVRAATVGLGQDASAGVESLKTRALRRALDDRQAELKTSHYLEPATDTSDLVVAGKELRVREEQLPKLVTNSLNDSTASRKSTLAAARALSSKSKCTKRDFRSQLPKIRDQTHLGICYAYAAADMASFKLKKNVSPLGIAIAYDKQFPWLLRPVGGPGGRLNIEGGKLGWAYMAGRSEGMCLDKNFGDSTRVSDFPQMKLARQMQGTEYSLLEYVQQMASTDSVEERAKMLKKLQGSEVCTVEGTALKAQFPTTNLSQIGDVVANSNDDSAIHKIFDRVCKPENITPLPEVERTSYGSNEKANLVKDLDAQLEKGEIVGLDYEADILSKIKNIESSGHSSTIVGREFNEGTGVCEYIVRNSWGGNCSHYHSAYKCENGNLWIPADLIAKAGSSLFTYK